jgi:hypothetical protein
MEKYPNLSDIHRDRIESYLTELRVDSCHHDNIMDICDTYLSQKEWQLSFSTKQRKDHIEILKVNRRPKDEKPSPPVSSKEARAEVKRLKKLCANFIETIEKGLTNFLMIHYVDHLPSLQEATNVLKRLNSELQNSIVSLEGKAGRSTNIARYSLISHLAGAYENCIGEKPGTPNPRGPSGEPDGPFLRFVYKLITILDGKRINPATLNTNIREVLDDINRVCLSDGSHGSRHETKV